MVGSVHSPPPPICCSTWGTFPVQAWQQLPCSFLGGRPGRGRASSLSVRQTWVQVPFLLLYLLAVWCWQTQVLSQTASLSVKWGWLKYLCVGLLQHVNGAYTCNMLSLVPAHGWHLIIVRCYYYFTNQERKIFNEVFGPQLLSLSLISFPIDWDGPAIKSLKKFHLVSWLLSVKSVSSLLFFFTERKLNRHLQSWVSHSSQSAGNKEEERSNFSSAGEHFKRGVWGDWAQLLIIHVFLSISLKFGGLVLGSY